MMTKHLPLKKALQRRLADPQFRLHFEQSRSISELCMAVARSRQSVGLSQVELARKAGTAHVGHRSAGEWEPGTDAEPGASGAYCTCSTALSGSGIREVGGVILRDQKSCLAQPPRLRRSISACASASLRSISVSRSSNLAARSASAG